MEEGEREEVNVREVIVKRTGEIVPFDPLKIEEAVKKAILVWKRLMILDLFCRLFRFCLWIEKAIISWWVWHLGGSQKKFISISREKPHKKTKARRWDLFFPNVFFSTVILPFHSLHCSFLRCRRCKTSREGEIFTLFFLSLPLFLSFVNLFLLSDLVRLWKCVSLKLKFCF